MKKNLEAYMKNIFAKGDDEDHRQVTVKKAVMMAMAEMLDDLAEEIRELKGKNNNPHQ